VPRLRRIALLFAIAHWPVVFSLRIVSTAGRTEKIKTFSVKLLHLKGLATLDLALPWLNSQI
jgi:hypothetical protein